MAQAVAEPKFLELRVPMPDEGKWGAAMLALPTDRQRQFVMALVEYGDINFTQAAIRAGFSPASASVTGHRLAHDEGIQAAIREEAHRRLGSAGIAASSFLLSALSDPLVQTKDKLKAAEMIFNRIGLPAQSEHKVTVEHTMSDDEKLERIKELAAKHGVSVQSLLGDFVDAEFTEVKEVPEGTPVFTEDEW